MAAVLVLSVSPAADRPIRRTPSGIATGVHASRVPSDDECGEFNLQGASVLQVDRSIIMAFHTRTTGESAKLSLPIQQMPGHVVGEAPK